MNDVTYAGKKTLFITSDDLFSEPKVGSSPLREKLSRLKEEGYSYIIVFTSLSQRALPKELREVLYRKHNSYFGWVTEEESSIGEN